MYTLYTHTYYTYVMALHCQTCIQSMYCINYTRACARASVCERMYVCIPQPCTLLHFLQTIYKMKLIQFKSETVV